LHLLHVPAVVMYQKNVICLSATVCFVQFSESREMPFISTAYISVFSVQKENSIVT